VSPVNELLRARDRFPERAHDASRGDWLADNYYTRRPPKRDDRREQRRALPSPSPSHVHTEFPLCSHMCMFMAFVHTRVWPLFTHVYAGIWRDFATPVPAYCIDGSILASYWTESNLAELACKDQFDDSCQDEACIRLGGAWGDVEKREPEYEGAGEGGAIVGGLAIVLIGAGILIRRRMRKQATPPLLQVTSATDAGAI